MRLFALLALAFLFTGCSNFPSMAGVGSMTANPLKSAKDRQIESYLTRGPWKYERQADDCKDTHWQQRFYKNRYYESGGSACLLANAFSVDAENWHIKKQILYITNLSPINDEDIIMKYGIDFLNEDKLILSRGKYKYTFYRNK